MLLLIDAGNTRVKWALVDASLSDQPGKWDAAGSVSHAELPSVQAIWAHAAIGRVLIANVAGTALRQALQEVLNTVLEPHVPVEWFASSAERAGVRNRYRNPAQLGCDRFAAAIGARAMRPDESLIVATCGTATTIDAVSADGVFVGGMILPGIALMTASLAQHTAQLPQVALQTHAQPFADHTDAAIVSGCLMAQTGAIERAVTALRNETRAENVTCILAGGAADLIAPQLSIPFERIDNLVLIGLQTVATSSC
ncbi:type III pantothenate kinase [Oxalicibacterium faecigallinarum]|uniref:Type III pantothenate kinase n=1 Tax=Oxalicibacterium faecigallinarum TaxID=573741 RepID=A0A8J3F3P1_9BURK|nr:type III pantothenate kinase [Oxalicibacterium faecigallinarum]GGI19780.1 type III pantothenate kinase [Oxalicibacterium faecigallinarum]